MELLYSQKHNVVAWPGLGDPERIAQAIPGASVVKGVLVAPVNLLAMMNAAHVGLPVKSPIETSYDWPRAAHIKAPMAHQIEMARFLTTHTRCHNLSEPGTGKTLGNLWASDFLMTLGMVRRCVIVAPLTTVYSVWRDAIGEHFPGRRKSSVVHGSVKQRIAAIEYDADYYIINNEGLTIDEVRAALVARKPELIIVDESHKYRHPHTARWKALRNFIRDVGNPVLWLNTGTPTPQEPTDAWGQQALLAKATTSQKAFRNTVMRQVTGFKWMPMPNADKIVGEFMQPAIRFRRDDCIDLPPTTYEFRKAEATQAQKTAMDALRKRLQVALESGAQVTAVHEGALRTKILQILAGAVYDKDHNAHDVDASTRMALLKDVMDECDRKVIVFAPFSSIVKRVADALRKDYSLAVITGETALKERTDAFEAFQREADPRVLVADPRTMSHGLTLTAANTIVWYAPADGGDVYVQANARIQRPSQTSHTRIMHIFVDPLERAIYSRNQARQSLQDLVMAWVKGENYGVE
jgi:SNF2 family DNA or RNA helicase